MKYQGPHPSDQQLLLDLDGEHPPNAAKQIRAHIDSCWTCRERRQELEGAMDDFISAYHQEMDAKIPPLAGPRALLKVRLAEIGSRDMRSRGCGYISDPFCCRPLQPIKCRADDQSGREDGQEQKISVPPSGKIQINFTFKGE